MIHARIPRALALVGLAALCAGCASDQSRGYAVGGGFPEGVRTIAVPIWENRTRDPEMGARVTEAIIKEVNRSTPWRVVSAGAATTLTGVITRADLRKLGQDSVTGLVQELAYDVSVDFTWENNRTRKPILKRTSFRAQGQFIPTRGVGEPIEVGQLGAIDALARAVVAELRSDW